MHQSTLCNKFIVVLHLLSVALNKRTLFHLKKNQSSFVGKRSIARNPVDKIFLYNKIIMSFS